MVREHGPHVLPRQRLVRSPAEHQRHDDFVRDHDCEGDAGDDHHGGRGREAADKGREGDDTVAGVHR